MKKPTGRKLLMFVILSIVYWALAFLPMLYTALSTCGEGDMPSCDPTPTSVAIALCAILYVALATVFFRKKLSGLD